MIDYNDLSLACKAGAMQQEPTNIQIIWDEIQQIKKDCKHLCDAINHIQEFLKEAYP